MTNHPAPILLPVVCTNCNEDQIVHLANPPTHGLKDYQEITCVNCHQLFRVMLPDKIIAGPFRSGSCVLPGRMISTEAG